ncbi:acyltransferase [Loktanella salsilacus]|uniref:acyltransferase family protein n=1 Tax=Loktanella salsilacus TaxID=195913 RepID=UPI0020B71844|nr:acyltransferase [Loktanella salsilacus]UTH48893.1 acyltransferase [Loktanella salsilacus]
MHDAASVTMGLCPVIRCNPSERRLMIRLRPQPDSTPILQEHSTRSRKKHVPELDGLRGIAVLAVIVAHCANAGFLPQFLGKGFGQQGVALFYLLSGYLIFYLYLDRDFTKHNIVQYTVARGARVLPLFYAVVLGAAVVWAITGLTAYGFDSTRELMANLLLIQGNAVLWSIPVEIQFYVLFVGLWWVYAYGYPICALLGLLAIQAALLVLTDTSEYSLPYWLHFFVIGGAASLINPNIKVPSWISVVMLCALPLALPEVRRMLNWTVLPNYYDPITAGYPVLLFLLVLWATPAFRFLAHPLLRYLGKISFGAYLLHWPLIGVMFKLGIGGWGAFSLVTGATLILASMSLYLYERPIQSFLRSRRW